MHPIATLTALIRAIDKNNISILKFLLEKGADPNIGSETVSLSK